MYPQPSDRDPCPARRASGFPAVRASRTCSTVPTPLACPPRRRHSSRIQGCVRTYHQDSCFSPRNQSNPRHHLPPRERALSVTCAPLGAVACVGGRKKVSGGRDEAETGRSDAEGSENARLGQGHPPDWEDSASSRITERSLYPKFVISGPDLRFRSGCRHLRIRHEPWGPRRLRPNRRDGHDVRRPGSGRPTRGSS